MAIKYSIHCLRASSHSERYSIGVAEPGPAVSDLMIHLLVRSAHTACRNHQKIIKPHFFESSLTERDNLALLDTASEYITKKAVSASVVLAEKGLKYVTDDAPWGGLASRTVLAAELIPMMVNIQGLTHRESFP